MVRIESFRLMRTRKDLWAYDDFAPFRLMRTRKEAPKYSKHITCS